MSLLGLPDELKLSIFKCLVDDYAALRAAVFVCKDFYNIASEVLRECRTLDFSNGLTDGIEDVLIELLTASAPSAVLRSAAPISQSVVKQIIEHGSRYNTLKLCFVDRKGSTNRQPIEHDNLVKLEAMWKGFINHRRRSLRAWRTEMQQRFADVSVRLLLRTLQHVTTFELGGCTSVLPLNWSPDILPKIRTFKFYSITNKRLAYAPCVFAITQTIVTIEFSRMSIDGMFFYDLLVGLSISTLHFKECWVAPAAFKHLFSYCSNLSVFEYTISTDYQPERVLSNKHLHLYSLLEELKAHAKTITELTLVLPNLKPAPNRTGAHTRTHCTHVASLSKLPNLKKLAISYKTLAPHLDSCKIRPADVAQQGSAITAWSILSRLPALQDLRLYCDKKMPVIRTLNEMAQGMGPAVLPDLRCVEVQLPWYPGCTAVRVPGKKELAVREALKERGVDVKFLRPRV